MITDFNEKIKPKHQMAKPPIPTFYHENHINHSSDSELQRTRSNATRIIALCSRPEKINLNSHIM